MGAQGITITRQVSITTTYADVLVTDSLPGYAGLMQDSAGLAPLLAAEAPLSSVTRVAGSRGFVLAQDPQLTPFDSQGRRFFIFTGE